MRASVSSSYRAVASKDDLEGALTFVGESSSRTAPRPLGEHAFARNAPIAHARALLIYLKHRGVLNVEEFRRSNVRGR